MEQCRILVDCGWSGTNELVADQGRDLWSDPLMAATSDRAEQYKLQISALAFNQLLDLSEVDVLRWIGLFEGGYTKRKIQSRQDRRLEFHNAVVDTV